MKIIRMLLPIFLCCSLLFAGCSGGKPDDSNETTVASETTGQIIDSVEVIYAVKAGEPQFVICYEDPSCLEQADYLNTMLKAKTKVDFPVIKGISLLNGRKAIFVGKTAEETLNAVYRENISYAGYGAVYDNGNIYLCGYDSDHVSRAVRKFLSQMVTENVTRDADGKVQAIFSKSMFFIHKPTYEISDATLLGVPLSSYRFVIPSGAESTLQETVGLIAEAIGERTGLVLEISQDTAEAGEHEIVIGAANRSVSKSLSESNELLEYRLVSDGNSVAVGYGGKIALFAAGADLLNLIASGDAGAVSLTANAKDTLLKDSAVDLSEGGEYRYMSYNLLGSKQEELHCSTQMRTDLAAEYIRAFKPDSVGLQELNAGNSICLMRTGLLDSYTLVSFEKVGSPWVSTLYQTAKYDLLESNCIRIKVNQSQDYYMTWVALRNKSTAKIYIHANLHLDYSSQENRLKQAALVNAELKSVLQKYPDAVLGMSGDYNAKSDNTALFSALGSGTNVQDAQLLLPADRNDADCCSTFEYVCISVSRSGTPIDHVLINTATTTALLHDVIQDSLVCHASDHYPLIVDVRTAQQPDYGRLEKLVKFDLNAS